MLLAATAAFTLFAGRGRRGVRAAAALVAGAAVVVAPLLLVWRPSVLVREWFIVPLAGGYLGHTGGVPPAGRRVPAGGGRHGGDRDPPARSPADRRRGHTGRAGRQHAPQRRTAHHVAMNCFPLLVFVPLALQRHAARARPAPARRRHPRSCRRPRRWRSSSARSCCSRSRRRPAGRVSSRARCTSTSSGARRATSFPSRAWPPPTRSTPGRSCPGCTTRSASRIRSSSRRRSCATPPASGACARRSTRSGPRSRSSPTRWSATSATTQNNPVDDYFRERYVACRQDEFEGLIMRAIDASWCP